ncbi:MAG: GH3 auxin-responsive promoter family protein, partial [Bacteroidales bacterium]|nr:GH3 auxin-responsive promoter family protein [Bacteroidales bacterium]
MSIINSIVNAVSMRRLKQIDRFREHPTLVQEEVLFSLIRNAQNTEWGKKCDFAAIQSISDFQKRVPIQTYEELKPYIDRVRHGEKNILWPGTTKWFAKSSGTTDSKSKFVPVTNESLSNCHYRGGKDVILAYLRQYPNTRILTGKTLTLGGSHQLDTYYKKSFYGDLSAVMIENVPFWVNNLRTPPKKVALLNDFDEKIAKIADISTKQHVVSFTGVPSWTLILMKYILAHTGKNNILDIWPDMELFIHGGVSFLPYREQYQQMFPSSDMHYLETYNASEGFFALQDNADSDDMLL